MFLPSLHAVGIRIYVYLELIEGLQLGRVEVVEPSACKPEVGVHRLAVEHGHQHCRLLALHDVDGRCLWVFALDEVLPE